ncbi:MAG: cytochrome c oxidase assembly protein, partial [Methylococcales bacterium]
MNNINRKQANKTLVVRLFLIVIGMFGFGFALVPLYSLFCDVTGLNGKVENQAVAAIQYAIDYDREIKVEFVTSLNENTPMEFRAEKTTMGVHPGQFYTVNFFAKNTKANKIIAQAIPSLSPGLAVNYLKKVECFCFSRQTFEAGEEKKMPVRFVIDPDLPEEYSTVTLSYT